MSKTKILLEGMGINPLEKIDNNCDSYWTLCELIDHCNEQLSIPRVSKSFYCQHQLVLNCKEQCFKCHNLEGKNPYKQ